MPGSSSSSSSVGNSSSSGPDLTSIKRAYKASAAAFDFQDIATNNGVQLVYAASNVSGLGRVVYTGTLTQTQASYTYAASPSDRLVINFVGGLVNEYTFTNLQGAFSGPASDFFSSDHAVAFRFVSAPNADFTVTRVLLAHPRSTDVTTVPVLLTLAV